VSSRRSPSRRAFSRRQWSRRWRIARRILVLLVFAGMVGAAVWLVFLSPFLLIESVEVEGNDSVSAQRVLAVADVPLGEQMARLHLDEVRARVAGLPPVEEVEVRRSWPHVVTISVAERTAVAVVERRTSYDLVDAHGVLFREVSGPRAGLPTIMTEDRRAAAEAAEVVASMPDDLAERVEQVEATTMDSITLHLRGDRDVVWGSADQSQRKAEVLAVLIGQEGRVLDVSVPAAPTISMG
jgi:cell division protein FtsQ